ncbi:hypothetical protein CYMTET_46935 [Cymbomonas tetramitiformis]|uniref:Uncharacterized protein n=1 Tax=Cymbomonas tetramitiformis TaxID=36881 RepID=A0AAE0BWD0_9CHLO|nr:hypothetical protein CYMTET_46937 [Cymbomonas tetramitiformis]KAK3243408.1 hypothetical protein CYMTET_46935 [Cymbomonas tetramitiformis]
MGQDVIYCGHHRAGALSNLVPPGNITVITPIQVVPAVAVVFGEHAVGRQKEHNIKQYATIATPAVGRVVAVDQVDVQAAQVERRCLEVAATITQLGIASQALIMDVPVMVAQPITLSTTGSNIVAV